MSSFATWHGKLLDPHLTDTYLTFLFLFTLFLEDIFIFNDCVLIMVFRSRIGVYVGRRRRRKSNLSEKWTDAMRPHLHIFHFLFLLTTTMAAWCTSAKNTMKNWISHPAFSYGIWNVTWINLLLDLLSFVRHIPCWLQSSIGLRRNLVSQCIVYQHT